MKRLSNALILTTAIVGLLLAGATAGATDLNFTFTPASPLQIANPGDEVSFVATATNGDSYNLYLNADSAGMNDPTSALTVDDSPFADFPPTDPTTYNGYLSTSDPYNSYTGLLFYVDVPAGTPSGNYGGYFTLLGGSDPSDDTDTLGTAYFTVQVTAVPENEDGFAYPLLAGAVCFGAIVFRRRIHAAR